MPNQKDYSKLSMDELLMEEKKLKKNEMLNSVLIGFLIGVLLFGIMKIGFGFFHIFLPVILIIWIYKNAQKSKQNLKKVQLEINIRNIRARQ
ncbi:MAG TPA: hypothetical protein ENK85_01875 [Saprospiraceae bacterium]|nr:hypothetical protein [Saprospiraceae bacterium]